MSNIYFESTTKGYHDPLHINVMLTGVKTGGIAIVCYSSGRNEVDYGIFDQNNQYMGKDSFTSFMEGPIARRFNRKLVDDLNVLLVDFDFELKEEDFFTVSKLAVDKCESRYGNSADEGDCIITIA